MPHLTANSEITVVVGLEVHVQLLTQTKIFCGCSHAFKPDHPNVQTCPVCLGLPGALPVMNAEALKLSVMTALAIGCEIAPFTKWDRKQYYYPDLPKGYQISQYDLPFSHDGHLDVQPEGVEEARRIRIIRAHLEEDAGKNMHDESGRGQDSRVDLNRAGTPLLEIVSHPDIRSAAEARTYLEELHLLLTYIGISDCNMQEGSLRCDANVNLHIERDGETIATPIVEVKNLNSFRAVEAAIVYEVARQQEEFETTGIKMGDPGGEKQTRGWDADRNVSLAQRGKEEASDYRYFPDPDLTPVTFSEEQVAELRSQLCEFPASRRSRFINAYGLSDYDAGVIIHHSRELADYFEAVASGCGDGKQAANWVTQDVLREMNERDLTIDAFPIGADVLAELLARIVKSEITNKSGREVFSTLLADADNGQTPGRTRVGGIIEEKGLAMVTDTGELDAILDGVIADNPGPAEDVRSGKQAALGPLIGQVMRQLKGADAKMVREMLLEKLSG